MIRNPRQSSGRLRLASALRAGVSLAALAAVASPALAEAPDTPVTTQRAAAPAPARPAPPTVSEVVVPAIPKVEPGAVIGDIKPDLQLAPDDIQSYGVSTITELLEELAPEIGSNSGRGGEGPAILLNGKRISSINEIRNLPTEAILRVDILPEEAALKYGFSANQRVVNIVLKDHVDAILADLQGGAATEGGGASGQAEAGVTRISGEHRLNIDLKYNPVAALTEQQRNLTSLAANGPPFDLTGNVIPGGTATELDPRLSALAGAPVTIAGVPAGVAGRPLTLADFLATANAPNTTDVRPFRSVVPESQQVSLNAVYTQPIFYGISATVNGTFTVMTSDTQRGLPGIGLDLPAGNTFSPFSNDTEVERLIPNFGPLNQDAESWTGHFGMSFNRDIASWRLALTGNFDHVDTRNDNDVGVDATALQAAVLAGTVNPFGPLPANLLSRLPQDTSRSKSDTGNIQFVASGPIWTIPAGEIRTSIRVGATLSDFTSESERGGIVTPSETFSQDGGNVQLSIDVPLTSAKNKILPMFGDLSANTHVAFQQVSGFGVLDTLGYGVHWTPITGLSILVNQLHDQAAPTQQQTSAPLLLTPNTRIFDFATGQTVDVTEITGGNPALTSDNRYRTSVRITFQPFQDKQLIFRADYNQIHYKNPIATFPAASAAIEAAFPERFIRDSEGDLTEVDYRPVNFASEDVNSLKWGFDYSRPIGPATSPPPRNQIAQALRKAGVNGVGRRPPGAALDPSAGGPGGPPGPDGSTPNGTPGGPGQPPGAAPGGPGNGPGPGGPGGGGPGGGAGFAGRGGGGGGGGFRGGGGRGTQDGRLRISVFHTIYFADRFLVAPGGPLLDFLNGSSLAGAGGQPQQEVQAQINIAERGYGAELNADWKSGSTVNGAAVGSTGDLTFSDLVKVGARVFADLNQRKTLIEQHPMFKGVRVSFSVSNIFDARQKVTDATGATPLNFQPAYLDPLGRTWKIEFRKLFSSGT
ncbi:TonB-dependent receptor [Phenylobacterium sp.]|uniref:TonB-dependent receptor n=1 Tax=Phenylobacterium sp. TaxID=1871053 RepID=UPI0025E16575|nr:TonB-dependent receptor [Phenylobacterium sp.]